jgi:hypothetical protein
MKYIYIMTFSIHFVIHILDIYGYVLEIMILL